MMNVSTFCSTLQIDAKDLFLCVRNPCKNYVTMLCCTALRIDLERENLDNESD